MSPDLALLATLIGSNYPCLELICMVPKVFEPLKFDCIGAYRSGQTVLTQTALLPLSSLFAICCLTVQLIQKEDCMACARSSDSDQPVQLQNLTG